MENDQDEDLNKLEEELIRKENEKRKTPMPISGRSVFEIKRIKDEHKKK